VLRAAVLTVSDSVSAGQKEDRSGPAVQERLQRRGWLVPVAAVLPDEAERIVAWLVHMVNAGEVDAIFTTGGTGIALRDVTPEATRSVIEREIPGLAERMRIEGSKHTSLAALSRGLAGVRRNVLIVNLPGSPKGAVESLDVIVELVPHIVSLLHGETAHS
jgi:molybdenum cofactor synthesis domain-containing protein